MQQRPRWEELAIPTHGRVRPKSGWRGSTTVTVSSGAGMMSSIGVVSWSGFSCSRRAEKHEVGAGAHEREIRQFAQTALGERGLKRELEAIQRLLARDTCR